ncbi:MAG TPA: diguanylate cyclase response regulator [Desulfobacteraceae bacterium]|nr:diguanylate cyclase response regulator [Desulfobacteraceae bacterium]
MKKPSILIVDDRPENLLTLEQVLESPDLDVVRAESGHEALEKTLDYEFALILLDVQMPVMDGYETATLLRGNKRTKNIPIIFVTAANKEEAHVFRGYGSGAVDYLFKPLAADVLTSKVKIFLELHNQRQLLEVKTRELDAKVAELEALKYELEESNEKLRQLSSLDGLTDLPNRRFFDETLVREWQRGRRKQTPLTLIIADIDHFKAYNDAYGHVIGDDCLKKVARGLDKSILRDVDIIARYGGEEFAAILPETDQDGGILIAERMLSTIRKLNITHEHSKTADHVTVSLGVATTIPSDSANATRLIQAADRALYTAKASGRNAFKVD